jgi:hypothetical protein
MFRMWILLLTLATYVLCPVVYDMSLMPGMSLPQMEASTQPQGMNSGASPTSAGATIHIL